MVRGDGWRGKGGETEVDGERRRKEAMRGVKRAWRGDRRGGVEDGRGWREKRLKRGVCRGKNRRYSKYIIYKVL